MTNKINQYKLTAIAIIIALIILLIYLFSPNRTVNNNLLELQKEKNVTSINASDEQKGGKLYKITCTDGKTYEIFLPPETSNLDSILESKCP